MWHNKCSFHDKIRRGDWKRKGSARLEGTIAALTKHLLEYLCLIDSVDW